MLIVVDASNTNLHYVYFTKYKMEIVPENEKLLQFVPYCQHLRAICVLNSNNVKFVIEKPCCRYTVISGTFLTDDLIFHVDETIV